MRRRLAIVTVALATSIAAFVGVTTVSSGGRSNADALARAERARASRSAPITLPVSTTTSVQVTTTTTPPSPTTTSTTRKPAPAAPRVSSNMARILACIRGPWHGKPQESSGNYADTPSGPYRGAYQFSVTTWNSVARRHFAAMVGVNPAYAVPGDQDRMAEFLIGDVGLGSGFVGQWPNRGECRYV